MLNHCESVGRKQVVERKLVHSSLMANREFTLLF